MKKVFIDANVFLDFWLRRPAGSNDAQNILIAAERKKVILYTSSSILLTAMYFLKKANVPTNTLIDMVDKLLSLLSIISPNEKTFRQGLYGGFTDLEDGIRYHTALQASHLDYFITNNKKDFKAATSILPVLTPKEFLAL